MSQSKSVHRSLAILKLPRPVPAFITFAQSVVTAMTNNTYFSSPTPPLSTVSAAITALQSAEAAALSRLKGAVTARNDKKAVLVALLQTLRTYVQDTADADAENSAAIIQSAGLPVKKVPAHKTRVFVAEQGPLTGSVKIVAPSAGPRSCYDWQYSSDGGKTWVDAPSTIKSKTTLENLTSGATVLFRYRTITPKGGQGDWSQAVALLVK